MVRYADDFVMGFEHWEDAQKVLRVLAKRCARFGLEINVEKTRLVPFGRPPFTSAKAKAGARPGSHPLQGTVAPRQLGGEAADRPREVPADDPCDS